MLKKSIPTDWVELHPQEFYGFKESQTTVETLGFDPRYKICRELLWFMEYDGGVNI